MTTTLNTPPTAEQVAKALDGVNDPEIRRPITELGMVKGIEVGADGAVCVQVWLTVAGCPLRETITRDVTAAVGKLPVAAHRSSRPGLPGPRTRRAAYRPPR